MTLLLALALGDAQAYRVSLATDVTPWFLDGFSFAAHLEPSPTWRWRFGAELWRMTFTPWLVDSWGANAGEGWHREFHHGVAVYGAWYPRGGGEGLSVGGAVDYLHSRIGRDGVTEVGNLHSLELLARVAFTWFPGSGGQLYLEPYVAAGPLVPLTPEPTLGGETWSEPWVQAIATCHVGWRFDRSH